MIARAASGRDGAIATLKRMESRQPSKESFVDVAAPWPYEERVRIAPSAPQSLSH
jgi:hypothetical protein